MAFPTEVTAPVKLALVVTLPAVSPDAVPVIFVPTRADGVPSAGVTSVGLVARTLLPVPVLVTLEIFLLASNDNAVDAVKFDNVVVPVIITVPMFAVVTLAVVIATFVSVTLPLLTVTLASVMLLSVVTVFPSCTAVLPNVMVVAKLLSRLDSGIDAVAVPKVNGTAI